MFYVIRDFRGPVGPDRRIVTLPEGKIVEDGDTYTISDLVASGVPLVPATASLQQQVARAGRTKDKVAQSILQQFGQGGAVGNVLHFDSGAMLGVNSQDGSELRPFSTIQAAVNAAPVATNAEENRRVSILKGAPGQYDENVTVNLDFRRILLLSDGHLDIGNFDGSSWAQSGQRRNITITGTGQTFDNIRPWFGMKSLGAIPQMGRSSHQQYLNSIRLSGQVDVQQSAGHLHLNLAGTTVLGSDGAPTGTSVSVAAGLSSFQAWLDNCIFYGQVDLGPLGRLQLGRDLVCNADVAVDRLGLVDSSDIKGNFTATNGLVPGTPRAQGFVSTFFDAGVTFTGPAGSFLVDSFSNYWAKANGVALGGAATKVIQADVTA
jgi:hypothetical protein